MCRFSFSQSTASALAARLDFHHGLLALLVLLPAFGGAPVVAENVSISPAAFLADGVFVRTDMAGAGGFRTSADNGCEVAPLQLPHGSILNTMTLWVRDDSDSGDVVATVWERKTHLAGPAAAVLAGASSGSNPAVRAVIATPPFGPHSVDTTNETFYVEVCYEAAGLELHHITIDYTGQPAGVDTASPFVVPPASFRSLSGRPSIFNAQEGYVQASSLNGGFPDDCFVAPVQLPEGVEIQQLVGELYDQSADRNIRLQLRRKRLNTGQSSELVAEVSTIGASTSIQRRTSTEVLRPVFDDAWEYYLYTPPPCPVTNSDHRIYAARVVHAQTVIFADGFESGDTSAWGAPPTPARERLLLPAAAFVPGTTGSFYTGHPIDAHGRLALAAAGCSYAPVSLPDGSSLELMTAFLDDQDAARNLTIRLWEKNDNAPTATLIGAASSSGAGGEIVAFDLLSGTVDTAMNHYYLEACLPAGASASSFGVDSVILDFEGPAGS